MMQQNSCVDGLSFLFMNVPNCKVATVLKAAS